MASDPGEQEKMLQESLVPSAVGEWKAEEDQKFDADGIFRYIDGAGEVYRSYNMRSLLARRFKAAGKPDLVTDLFDMGNATDAFGVFTHDLEGEEAGIGQGSTYKGGLLSFWKDRYFVSIYAEEENDETRSAVFALGRDIDRAIRETGHRPRILDRLPREGLAVRSIRYFHNHSVLNYHFFVADRNILHLDQRTEAVLASYDEASLRTVLLLVRYPDDVEASRGMEEFRRIYLHDAVDGELIESEDGTWTGAVLEEDLIAVVFQAPSRSFAEDMLRKIAPSGRS